MSKETITMEDLASMVKRGFDNTATKADIKDMATKADIKDMATKADIKRLDTEMQAGFKRVDERFSQVNARLDTIERDIKGFVTQEDFEDALGRISYMEGKLGIVAGK